MNKKNHQLRLNRAQSSGFTLIELLVVIVMVSIFLLMAILIIDPISQLDKAKDAERKHNFEQIKNALDIYYNDNNCYPTQQQNISFGQEWKDSVSGVVYMKKVPQDPDCNKTGYCYVYQADQTSSCPQWNVLYARLSRPTNSKTSCVIQICGFGNVKYNYCVSSGNIDCSYIKVNTLPLPSIPSSTPNPTPAISPSPTPTPAISPSPTPGGNCSPNYFAVSSGLCNSVTPDKCIIYGGPLTCYSGAGGTTCTGYLCTQ